MTFPGNLFYFLNPFFASPFDFPGFPVKEDLHRMVVHFPVALLIVASVFDGLSFFKRRRFYATSAHLLFYIGYFSLLATFASGLLTANRKGISLTDPDWIKNNAQLAASIINHRGLAVLTVTVFTILAVARKRLLRNRPWVAGPRRTILTIATALALVLLSITAHFGGNIAL